MLKRQREQIEERLRHLAAEYLKRESNRLSLITVTGIRMSDELGRATILVSVYPEEREAEALGFLKRSRTDFREFVKDQMYSGRIPHLDFEIDHGEKHRQTIQGMDLS